MSTSRFGSAEGWDVGGYVGGKPPYGFRMVPVTRMTPEGSPVVIQILEHDPDEVPVIQDMWARIKKHKDMPYQPGGGRRHPGSLTGICAQMTADGVPTKGQRVGKKTKDSVWDPRTAMRILRDPRIAYRCRRRRALPGQHEGECTITMQTLDLYVARRIFALIQTAQDDPETAVILAEAARRYTAQAEKPEVVGERRSLITERADAKHALEELYDREEAGDYDDPVGRRRFRERRERLVGRMERAEACLAQLEEAATPALPIHLWLPIGAGDIDPVGEGSWWEAATTQERRDFVKLFVRRVVVTKASGAGRSTPVEKRAKIKFVRPEQAKGR